jgi:hypothetical protein
LGGEEAYFKKHYPSEPTPPPEEAPLTAPSHLLFQASTFLLESLNAKLEKLDQHLD